MVDTIDAHEIPPESVFYHNEGVEAELPDDMPRILDTVLRAYQIAQQNERPYGEDPTGSRLINDLLGWADHGGKSDALKKVFSKIGLSLSVADLQALEKYFLSQYSLWVDAVDSVDTQVKLDQGSEEVPYKEKLYFATQNQKLSVAIYHAHLLGPNDPSYKQMHTFITAVKNMHSFTGRHEGTSYRKLVNGALAQAAQMRMLEDMGCYILVPNPEDQHNMEITDMRGVDFCAIAPDGKILFIDSKGPYNADSIGISSSRIQRRAQLSLRETLLTTPEVTLARYPGIHKALQHGYVESYEIAFPTNPTFNNNGIVPEVHRQNFENVLRSELNI